jgi:hypothetical protein
VIPQGWQVWEGSQGLVADLLLQTGHNHGSSDVGPRQLEIFEVRILIEKLVKWSFVTTYATIVLSIIPHCKIAVVNFLTNCHWLKLRTIPNILLTRIFIYNGC